MTELGFESARSAVAFPLPPPREEPNPIDDPPKELLPYELVPPKLDP